MEDKNKMILYALLAVFAITAYAGYNFFKGAKTNYSDEITDIYQAVSDIQSDLSVAAGNLSATDSEKTSEDFIKKLNSSKESLMDKNKTLNNIDVPEKSSDDIKKLTECLKTEYNLMNRLKEILSIKNEYDAVDDFNKSKDLMIDLKEKSAMLSIEGNNFEDVLNLAAVYEKIEKYLATRKQLRYDRDMATQAAETQAAAQAERDRQAAANNPLGYYWIQDQSTGVYMQNPSPIDGETISWSGGYVYEGSYKYANGYGTTTWRRYGDVIQIDEGNFVKGRKHGEFKHRFYPGGRVGYSGWSNGVMIW